MATRAQRFKAEQERSSGKRRAPSKRVEERRPSPDSGARNLKSKAGKNAQVVTEVSLSGRPSRKSSRASAHHGKPSTQLEYAARQKSFSPQRRHQAR
jgi:hypothetical protein